MKIYYHFAMLAIVAWSMNSCVTHDPFADRMELGQIVPTVDWEQGSTDIKAGSYATFKAKYYTSPDNEIDHSEVWVKTKRSESAAATSKLTTSLSYTKTVTTADTVRVNECIATYPHSKAEWDGHEYVLTDSFPTSRTLIPVNWPSKPEVWDQEQFDSYYPAGFADEFCAYLVNALTRDSAYYNDLRNVYINYDFTQEQFEALNAKYNVSYPTVTETGDKSDAWFTTDEVDHYYYITVVDSVTVYREVATEAEAPAGVNTYPVYKSSPWLFSRYSDDTGGRITTVRRNCMPYWKELIEMIPFTSWIYDTANSAYSVTFTRSYSLLPEFRVVDKKNKHGVTTNNMEISLN